jgi:hypothetical protein
MEKTLFVDFCQIFENKKSKIRNLGLCRHFERFSKTLFHKMLELLSCYMFQAWKANVKFLKIFLQPAKHARLELDLFGSHTKLLLEPGMDLLLVKQLQET